MPHLNGFQVMDQFMELEKGSYAPILVLTAQDDQDTRNRALNSGARDFIVKPFNMLEVLNRIHNMLEVRLLHKEVNLHNKHLEEKVNERTEQLKFTQSEIVKRLGRAGEYRDNETGMHVIRMSYYSHELGLALGMDSTEADILKQASPLHDIGKIGIPDAILLKPGKLNHDEWSIMKTHSLIGMEILSGSDTALLQKAEVIAMTHHEKYDGSGYPQGLSGEDIPMEGRIVAIADVFDALTTCRPYKKAWTIEESIIEIKDKSGQHFDPEMVQKFVSILDKVTEIKEEYMDANETQHVNPLEKYLPSRTE